MKPFRWNASKNERLKDQRGISFEQIELAVASDGLRDILQHSNSTRYPGQQVLVVVVSGYAYLVPCVEEVEYYFLKTIIPSRKATRDYLGHGGENGQA